VPLEPDRLYQVVEDFDGLHIVPTYRVISDGTVLLQGFSLLSCAVFAATYISQLAAGKHSRTAIETALSAMQAKGWDTPEKRR
jgi:hypothetical protein